MRIKVLFAIPTLGSGGAERVLISLLNNLDESKYDITLFTVFDGGINKKYLKKHIKYKYYFKRLFRGNIHLFKLFTPKRLYKTMINEEYDIAISYLEGPMTRIIGGCSDSNTKLINWVHTEVHNSKVIAQSYRSIKEVLNIQKRFSATVFVSDTARIAFENTFKNVNGNFLVKYNTVDSQFIKSKSIDKVTDVEFDKNKVNLISVGRFTSVKGYIRLIKIVKLLINNNVNVHLYLLGEGELHDRYNETIRKLGLNNNVTILGFKENPYKYVKKCDLFVCSSYEEGFSTAVTESLIVGTPVVTTLCSGMEELLGSNNEFGLITENNDEALYQGLRKILTEQGLLDYYKKQVIKRGSSFSTKKTVAAIEQILDGE